MLYCCIHDTFNGILVVNLWYIIIVVLMLYLSIFNGIFMLFLRYIYLYLMVYLWCMYGMFIYI